MQIIQIEANSNGSHENALVGTAGLVPFGWARVPEGMEIPDSFPFVDIEVNGNTVTAMTAREVPEKEPAPEVPTDFDRLEAQVMYTAVETGTLLEVE